MLEASAEGGVRPREHFRGLKSVPGAAQKCANMAGDVGGISSPLSGARFYLTGLRDAKGGELLYLEIPFQK